MLSTGDEGRYDPARAPGDVGFPVGVDVASGEVLKSELPSGYSWGYGASTHRKELLMPR